MIVLLTIAVFLLFHFYSMNKFCKDCKHFREYLLDGFTDSFCKRPTGETDLVHGESVTATYNPYAERSHGECGPEGKHFEKNQPFLMRFLKTGKE